MLDSSADSRKLSFMRIIIRTNTTGVVLKFRWMAVSMGMHMFMWTALSSFSVPLLLLAVHLSSVPF